MFAELFDLILGPAFDLTISYHGESFFILYFYFFLWGFLIDYKLMFLSELFKIIIKCWVNFLLLFLQEFSKGYSRNVCFLFFILLLNILIIIFQGCNDFLSVNCFSWSGWDSSSSFWSLIMKATLFFSSYHKFFFLKYLDKIYVSSFSFMPMKTLSKNSFSRFSSSISCPCFSCSFSVWGFFFLEK